MNNPQSPVWLSGAATGFDSGEIFCRKTIDSTTSTAVERTRSASFGTIGPERSGRWRRQRTLIAYWSPSINHAGGHLVGLEQRLVGYMDGFKGKPRTGWAGQWDRHRWPVQGRARRSRRGKGKVTGAELKLVLLAGALLGIGYTQLNGDFEPPPTPPSEDVQSGPVRVIDGDTFRYGGETIRIADIDTPETHPARCAYEAELGARATRRLETLLGAGPFQLQPIGRDEDRYGRKLRVVTRNGQSLGDVLVSEGLARTWTGRREPWCA